MPHIYTGAGELGKSIGDRRLVVVLDQRASWVAQVGDEICEGVGFDAGNNTGSTTVGIDGGDHIVDVLLVESGTILVVEQFTVGLGTRSEKKFS